MYAKSGDVHLAYHVQGEGPPDLLWIFGSAIPIESTLEEPRIARFRQRLASFSRLICFDRRGVGLSDPVMSWDATTLEVRAADAIAVLDAVGSERTAVLATDFSACHVATMLAATYPDRVAALVLNNPAPRTLVADDYPWGITERELTEFIEILRGDLEKGDSRTLDFWIGSEAIDDRLREWWLRAVRRGMRLANVESAMRVVFGTDARAVLPTIQAPTLIVHDEGPAMWRYPEHARYTEQHVPRSRRLELKGSHMYVYASNGADALVDEVQEFITGLRPGPDIDRVLATVVFTDIVASTEQAAEAGDTVWRGTLDDHDAMVRRQLTRFEGREVKTMGDGFLATFAGPARAIRCALAIRDSARQLGLEVRAGIHTGECDIRGEDIGGIAVHISARVSALAAGNEVLVSSTVRDLVIGSQIEFEDRGTHELKGVPGRWQLYAVLA